MRPLGAVMLFALLATPAAQPLSAQAGCDTTRNPWTFLRQCFNSALPQGDTVAFARGLHEAVTTLRNPSSLNPALAELAEITNTRRFIGALHLNFVSIQQGSDQGLAVAYDWRRDITRTKHQQGSPHGGFHTGFEARGLLVPAPDSNPEHFNEVAAHSSYFYGRGGGAQTEVMRAHLAGIADSAAAYRPPEAYLGSPAYRSYMAGLWDSLSTQFYFTGGPEVRHESNQGGTKSQWLTGLRMGFDVKVWNPRQRGARFNVVDWPTALIRWATGTDSTFRPSGAAIPTVSILFHRVTPGSNAVRDSLLNLDPFTRLAVELRWRTKLSEVHNGPLWLTGEFRQHLELSPDSVMSRAGLHRHARVHLQVETPGGLTVSWAKGTLPFTESGDDRWGIGFQLKYR